MVKVSQPDSVFIRTTIDKLQQELETRLGTREAMNSNVLANAKVAIKILKDAEIVYNYLLYSDSNAMQVPPPFIKNPQ